MKKLRTDTYDKVFYSYEMVSKAINDYKQFADIKLKDNGSSWECSFNVYEHPDDLIINEFGNYLIELAQSK